MALYDTLKAAIDSAVAANGVGAITGPSMNAILDVMVDSLGLNNYKGVAAPGDTPATGDGQFWYITAQTGTYTNFNGCVMTGSLAVLCKNTSGVYEITQVTLVNNPDSYVDIAANKIYHINGYTTQLYYKSLLKVKDSEYYNFRMSGFPYARRNKRFYELHSDFAPSPSTLTMTAIAENQNSVLDTETFSLVVKGTGSNPASLNNILVVVDQYFHGLSPNPTVSAMVSELSRLCRGGAPVPAGLGYTNLDFIGRVGAANNKFEGYPGKSWKFFTENTTVPCYTCTTSAAHGKTSSDIGSIWIDIASNNYRLVQILTTTTLVFEPWQTTTAITNGTMVHIMGAVNATVFTVSSNASTGTNAFWSGGLNFTNYQTLYGTIHHMVICLGYNDIVNGGDTEADFTSITINYAVTFLNALHTQLPSVKVKVCGLIRPSQNGGVEFKNTYDNANFSTWTWTKRVIALNKAYKTLCALPAYNTWVEFIDLAAQVDSDNGVLTQTKAVNNRSAVTETIGASDFYLTNSGHYQVADAIWRNLIATICN